jgi:hypothetical protein
VCAAIDVNESGHPANCNAICDKRSAVTRLV